MGYLVKYRKIGRLFWRRLRSVQSDGIIPESPGVRFFILDSGNRREISTVGTEFDFSSARGELIKAQLDAQKAKANGE